MSLRSWISHQLQQLVGFSNEPMIDYLIAQTQQPNTTQQTLIQTIQEDNSDNNTHTQEIAAFAQQLLERVPKAAPSSTQQQLQVQSRREAEQKKQQLVQQNERYTLITQKEEEEEDSDNKRKTDTQSSNNKSIEHTTRTHRDRDGDKNRGSRRSVSPPVDNAKSKNRDESKDMADDVPALESDSSAVFPPSLSAADRHELEKQQDLAARDAFIQRLAEREKNKSKHRVQSHEDIESKATSTSSSSSSSSTMSDAEIFASMSEADKNALMSSLRVKARHQYLSRREQQQLQLLQMELQMEEELFGDQRLTRKEQEMINRKRKVLELATQRKAVSDEVQVYQLPGGYLKEDGMLDKEKKNAVLHARYVEDKRQKVETEQERWEREQTKHSRLTVGAEHKDTQQQPQYPLVFDTDIEFIKSEAIAGTHTTTSHTTIKPETTAPTAAVLSEYDQIQLARRQLPIYPYRQQLLSAIEQHQILIIVGETGSGKTTQIMQYLYESGYCRGGKKVGCTQPRRVAAMSVASRVAKEMGVKLGAEVGYSIRFEDCTSERTVIKYLTDGMLLREFLSEPDLQSYSVMVLDEAHERTLHTDILFGLLKDIAKARKDLKILISSATLDADKFSNYFDHAPVFFIPGRRYPVDIYYTAAPEADYVEAAIVTVLQIHTTQPAGDILVFLTGQEEIETMMESLQARVAGTGKAIGELLILPIYSALPSEQQAKIFEPAPPHCRKVILATNIAETSLTIDGIIYVIDPGFNKIKSFNPRTGMESLLVEPISKASANQRAGRAGRVAAGKCFRLYTKLAYHHELEDNTIPEIQRTNLTHVVLMLKSLGIDDVLNFDYMDKPPVETLIVAFTHLYALGALNDSGQLTTLGRRMAELPMDPQLAKMLLGAEKYHCTEEVMTICAMLGVGSGTVFYTPKDKHIHAQTAHKLLHHQTGDHMTLLHIYQTWSTVQDYSADWCYDHFIQLRSMKRARDIREQLVSLCERIELQRFTTTDTTLILKAVTSGFFYQLARLDRQGHYKTMKQQLSVTIHPSSALAHTTPRCVLYHELVLTKKEYIRCVSEIDMLWLIEIAPHIYEQNKILEWSGKIKLPKQKKTTKAEE